MKIIFIIILLATNLYAEENKWTTQDTILQGVFYSICIIDWFQTNYTQKNQSSYHEVNPLLGKNPTRMQYTTFGISCMLVQTGIAYFLPKPYRGYWQFLSIGVEGCNVWRNYTVCTKLSF